MKLTTSNIQNALNGDNFWMKSDSEEAALIIAATNEGYVKRLSHTQAQWASDYAYKLATRELRSDEQNEELIKLATTHVIKLVDLKLVPLSTQLSRITGDTFAVGNYKNIEFSSHLHANAGTILIHIKTGLQFQIPA